MDFNAAMETFAEAWVAANTPTAISNPECQKSKSPEELPTMLPREQITTPSEPEIKSQSPKKVDPNSTQVTNAKSLPIHCVIEQVSGIPSFENVSSQTATLQGSVELDSYAILPNSTLLQDLVRAALLKLGYNSADAMNAKGAIQIKNWKPLCFDSISDNSQSTIEDILGELTNTATLRIRLASVTLSLNPSEWADSTVRSAVILLLKECNQSKLAKLSPLPQSMISSILNNKHHKKLSSDKCRQFGEWYTNYRQQSKEFPQPDGTPKDARLTFHPQYEIPLLRGWFQKYRNPPDETLEVFSDELNRSYVRQERPQVTAARLRLWWKNERQKDKRIMMDKLSCESPQTVRRTSKRKAVSSVTQSQMDTDSNAVLDDANSKSSNAGERVDVIDVQKGHDDVRTSGDSSHLTMLRSVANPLSLSPSKDYYNLITHDAGNVMLCGDNVQTRVDSVSSGASHNILLQPNQAAESGDFEASL